MERARAIEGERVARGCVPKAEVRASAEPFEDLSASMRVGALGDRVGSG